MKKIKAYIRRDEANDVVERLQAPARRAYR
jgi:hypothetical protein